MKQQRKGREMPWLKWNQYGTLLSTWFKMKLHIRSSYESINRKRLR